MTEKQVLTPYEMGLMAAITLIGTALATLDPTKRDLIKSAAEDLINSMPADRSYSDGSSGHHIPLQALISGLYPEKSKKSHS